MTVGPIDFVKLFQRSFGLVDDGIAGIKTLAKLDEVAEVDLGSDFGGKPLRPGVNRDPHLLLPGFADKIGQLFNRMRQRGFDPLLWEGYRSQERANKLSKLGTGVKRSLHCIGAAADIIDRDLYWDAGDEFWQALGEEAEALGLTWGGRWKRKDFPHVQAIPVDEQNEFWAMSEDQRKERVI